MESGADRLGISVVELGFPVALTGRLKNKSFAPRAGLLQVSRGFRYVFTRCAVEGFSDSGDVIDQLRIVELVMQGRSIL